MTADFRLDARYTPKGGGDPGTMTLELTNLSSAPLSDFVLAYSAMTRVADGGLIEGGRLNRRVANFHEIAPVPELTVRPGETWTLALSGLTHAPRHRTDGPKSAYLVLGDGSTIDVAVGDLLLEAGDDSGALKQVPPGQVDVPIAVTPWPRTVDVEVAPGRPAPLAVAAGTAIDDSRAVSRIAELANRLFPVAERPFVLHESSATRSLTLGQNPALPADGYAIAFAPDSVTLECGGAAGRDYGLITLAHIFAGAAADPDRFGFPTGGTITDAPRFAWRGSHLDVSRHFYPTDMVRRFIDILAWLKMNVLQWHLTDDEGWRLEIKALPELTSVGALRGADCLMVPQLGSGATTYGGHYSQDEVRDLVAHASALHVEIVPEIDLPGHCHAVLEALPHLRDPDEPSASYHSIQGYPNNALNPALPATYDFVQTVMGEVATLFPSLHIHIGGDEVDESAWLASPAARDMMEREGLKSTGDLHRYFSHRVREMILGLGKQMAAWDEVGDEGEIPRDTLLVAWREREKVGALIEAGYEVVASPGQRFYMDMVQASGWSEPGASWAGVSTPEDCYAYEPTDGLPQDAEGRLIGVQAGIWSEHLISPAQFNHMVFPRLGSVAEAGWSDPASKDWQRFAALSRFLPEL
ncbi:beta-N-acetylhexosaminidase [Bauldia sp.]|uniref:beta-N-acetylhexosaminidase n=1 Tax=Bauldia sp. TaxID=2575872 RepID=UPI003BAAE454